MARIAVFVEKKTLRDASELKALERFREAADRLGHRMDLLFRSDLGRIPEYDAMFIRAYTDPMNASYVASRLAELHGLRVIDDPDSIIVCCDKVHMYHRLLRAGVAIPDTAFVRRDQISEATATDLFARLGTPVVVKAPQTAFSRYVEKVSEAAQFVRVGRRFTRRSDRLVVQRYCPTTFDWRVVTLAGEVLLVCKYMMAADRWRIVERQDGRTINCAVEAVEKASVDPAILDLAVRAGAAIGNGLYGVDIKETAQGLLVIEVNDNPNIDAGYEDTKNPEIYETIVRYLAEAPAEAASPASTSWIARP